MKASRSYLLVIGVILGALCFSHLLTLNGYFQAVESGGSGGISEKRLLSQLQYIHGQFKNISDSDDAKRQMRSVEALMGQGSESETLAAVRRNFAPILAVFAEKPKEAEERVLLIKKRELMESLVNAYRKEIPNGSIPVRAAYLNILFDTQNSLLNEGSEVEQVYIQRTRDRFAAMKSLSASLGDQARDIRVSNLDAIFTAYDRGFDLATKWREKRTNVLAAAEKTLPKLARDTLGAKDDQADGMRRSFLYSCILALSMSVLGFLVLFICHKILKLRFYSRADAFLRILKEFGRERMEAGHQKDLDLLRGDPDWEDLAQGAIDSEAEFVAKHQAMLAVPKSLQIPYIVFSKDQTAQLWSQAAGEMFALQATSCLDEVITENTFSSREESITSIVETIRNSFSASKEDVFELLYKDAPYELLSYPVISGPLAGGKLYIFREIRSESARIDKAVALQLARVRTYVHKISHHYPVEILSVAGDTAEVKEALGDLDTMKRKLDEREILWKSETGALLDQVGRQREILERLASEITQIRTAHGTALELVGSIQIGDEDWHDEICLLEKEMQHWKALRERLAADLGQHEVILQKARTFESGARASAAEVESFLGGFDEVLNELRNFSEEAKVHAVNMAFTGDASQREFSAQCRAYANEIGSFVEQAESLGDNVRSFLQLHPASALAPHLASTDLDPGLLDGLVKEEERLSIFVQRWKADGQSLVAGGMKAMELLRQADKKSAVANQLGETSLLINDQAKSNLQRWN